MEILNFDWKDQVQIYQNIPYLELNKYLFISRNQFLNEKLKIMGFVFAVFF